MRRVEECWRLKFNTAQMVGVIYRRPSRRLEVRVELQRRVLQGTTIVDDETLKGPYPAKNLEHARLVASVLRLQMVSFRRRLQRAQRGR